MGSELRRSYEPRPPCLHKSTFEEMTNRVLIFEGMRVGVLPGD